MAEKLDENRYLLYEKYCGLRLIANVITIAKNIQERYSLFAEFLKMIHVDKEVSHLDAEGIEQHLHPQTYRKVRVYDTHVKEN